MKQVLHVIKLDEQIMKDLKRMAEDVGIPFGAYMRLIVKQHHKTPFDLKISAPGRKAV